MYKRLMRFVEDAKANETLSDYDSKHSSTLDAIREAEERIQHFREYQGFQGQTGDAIKTLADLPAQLIKQIEFHFNNYKALKKPGSTKVDHWGDIEEAKQVIRDSQQRWKQQ